MKKYFLLFLTIIICPVLKAQLGSIPVKWGKFSKEELNMKNYEKDSSASALILYNFGTVYFEIYNNEMKVVYEKIVRIKIFNRSGFRYGDVEIPYFFKNSVDRLIELKAHTINVNSEGKTEESIVGKDLIFDVDVNGNIHNRKFTFPNIKEGSIIEYTYTIRSDNFLELKPWYFQTELPVAWSEYRLKIPDAYTYYTITRGSKKMDIVENGNSVSGLQYMGAKYDNANINETRYVMKDVKGLSDEPFSIHPYSYFSSIRMQLNHISFPRLNKPIIEDWDAFRNFVIKEDFFGNQLKHYSFAKDLAEQLVNPTDPELIKIIKIYDYVRKNISWNGQHYFYIDDLKKSFEKKSGNGTEVNAILLSILREAGISADPVLICTRDKGVMQKLYPLISNFDHVIVKAKADSSVFFLDGIDPFRPYSLIDDNDLDVTGFVCEENKWAWTTIKNSPISRSNFNYNCTLKSSGEINGNVVYQCNLFESINAKTNINNHETNNFMIDLLNSELFKIKIDSAKALSNDSAGTNISFSSNLSLSSSTEGKFIYVTPFINGDLHSNPFENETRNLPVEFRYPINKTYNMNLILPAGFKISSLPKNIKITLPDNGVAFTFLAQGENNVVQLKSTFNITRTKYEIDEYDQVKELFSNISKVFSQQIVLEKE